MDLFLQLLFTGIGIGAVYALVALGFVLIFRATNVVNFAQGEFSMVAAYLMVVFSVDLGWPYWLSFLIALAGMALLGIIFNLGVYYPLRHRSFLPVIIATIGASILLSNSVLAIYGPQPQVLQGWFETIAFMKANKAKTVEITAKVLHLNPSVINRTYDDQIAIFSTDGTFDPAAVAVLKKSFIDMGLLKTEPDDKALFTTQFVPVKVGK